MSSQPAIPDEAYQAAKEAAQARGWIMEPSVIRAMLAAAFPLIERQVRDQVATEIEAQPNRYRIVGKPESYDPYLEGWDDGTGAAAHVVRGTA